MENCVEHKKHKIQLHCMQWCGHKQGRPAASAPSESCGLLRAPNSTQAEIQKENSTQA